MMSNKIIILHYLKRNEMCLRQHNLCICSLGAVSLNRRPGWLIWCRSSQILHLFDFSGIFYRRTPTTIRQINNFLFDFIPGVFLGKQSSFCEPHVTHMSHYFRILPKTNFPKAGLIPRHPFETQTSKRK